MLKILKSAIVILLAISCAEEHSQGRLFINEIVFEGHDNDKLDFIEIYNLSLDSVSLSNAYLFIDSLKINLNKDAGVKGGEFFFQKIKGRITNKKFVAKLYVNDKVVDEINWNNFKSVEYLGRFPDGQNTYRLGLRSLGKTNNSSAIKIGKPSFELKEGNYSSAQKLTLMQEYSNVPLYYTLDGSNPNKKSFKYSTPIAITTNTTITAQYIGKIVKSKIVVKSYLIKENTNLPIVSIVLDSLEFWDKDKGLIKKGPGAEKAFPYKGANFWKDIKLDVQFQIFDGDEKILDEPAKLKIHGNYSRGLPLKGLRLKSVKRNFDFSPYPDKTINSFSELTLRASGQDMGQAHFRDAFAHNYFGEHLNLDVQKATPVTILVNGKYYGLGHIREVYNQQYFDNHYGCGTGFTMLKLWGVPMFGQKSDAGFGKIKSILNNDKKPKEQRALEAVKFYDFENWMDYFIAETYSGNKDWFPNNAKYWRSSVTNKWRYVLNDLDAGFGRTSDDAYKYDSFKFLKEKSPNKEFIIFMASSELRNKFLIRYMDLLNTVLNAENITNHAKLHQKALEPHMDRFFDKYNWKKSIKKWHEYEIPKLYGFYAKRPKEIRAQLQNHFDLKAPYELDVFSKGSYSINSLKVNGGLKAYYFDHQKIIITAESLTGKVFSHFVLNGKKLAGKKVSISGKSGEKLKLEILYK
jgi:hypothetical protein|tara:strand:- start:10438 stop:12507 length:2070 start_codon:yes stop_codon:yes gene_type:complete